MMKSKKYQQGMAMVIQLVVYWIILQIVFQGVVEGDDNTKIRLHYS